MGKALRFLAKARHKARKTPLAHYAQAWGSGTRSVIGTKLNKRQRGIVKREKARRRRKDKRIAKKIWRKII